MTPDPTPQGAGRPGVSVVIPAYNYARFLPAAIDSALAQEYLHTEIIVVNDGSTDDTPAVLERYGNRIKAIHQANAGLPAARNAGIQAAQHPFVAFLDADDFWQPTMLSRVMETFATLPAEFGLVACGEERTDATGKPVSFQAFEKNPEREISVADIILQTRFGPSATVVKKEVFAAAGLFDTTLRSSEDRDMWIRIAAQRRVYRIADKLAMIRRHGGNMSMHADRMKLNMNCVLGKAYRVGLVPRSRWWFWLQVRGFFHFQTSQMFNGAGRRVEAFRSLAASAICWPWYLRPERLNQPALFRLRAAVRYFVDGLHRRRHGPPA